MDYEKKYNEALERARNLMEQIRNNELLGFPDQFTEIFPELRESEDEKIRKAIIRSIEEDSSVYEQEVSKEQMLAYLEKQKEQNKCPEFCSGHCVGCEQKEQKPVVTHGETYHVDTLGTQQVIAGKMPQKPAEKHNMAAKLKEHLANTPKEQLEAEWKELEKWNHVGPTVEEYFHGIKPAEWSEEDEKMLNLAIEWAETMSSQFSFVDMKTTDFRKIASWLKSLRPSRKPSEEQIRSLEYFIKLWGDSNGQLKYTKVFNDVKSLCEQLKKL